MRFNIRHVGSGSERVGQLSGLSKNSNANVETPTSALLTQGGSVVHLTAEVLAKVFTSPQLLWVPLSSVYQLEKGTKAQGEGLAKFSGVSEHIICTSLNNINDDSPQGHFKQDKVPLWTRNGKKLITSDRYMDVMEVFKPDIVLAIADGRTSLCESTKRIFKSVDRTCKMLSTCVKRYTESKELQDSSLIGVIVGASQPKKCEECIHHILLHKDVLSGIALSGITDGTNDSYDTAESKFSDILKTIQVHLPTDLVRFIEGAWNPAVIMMAIEHGWDVFDGTYPLKLTNTGQALKLEFDLNQNSDELCILDLVDTRYKEDFRPILEGCECLACKKHTRAYIRHLLNTREMLASVLLSIHNLHHFDQMFRQARSHIAANTFSLYKEHITKQYELYRALQVTMDTQDGTKDLTQVTKKIKVMENSDNSKLTNGVSV